jgi:hypothetical protein
MRNEGLGDIQNNFFKEVGKEVGEEVGDSSRKLIAYKDLRNKCVTSQ